MRQVLLILAGIAVFGFLLARGLMGEAAVECEACMTFEGQRACGRVAAQNRQEAAARAVSHACGILTTGVTRSLACEREAPSSLTCSEP